MQSLTKRKQVSTPLSRYVVVSLVSLAFCAFFVPSASAAFGITDFGGLVARDGDGTTDSRAASHPYSNTTRIAFPDDGLFKADGQPKDIHVALPAGFVGNPTVTPLRCTTFELYENGEGDRCPAGAQVGTVKIYRSGFSSIHELFDRLPLYNMVAPTGFPARFAFIIFGSPIILSPSVRVDGDYGLTVSSLNTSQVIAATESIVTFWGNPADPSHDPDRGRDSFGRQCAGFVDRGGVFGEPGEGCSNPANYPSKAFLTNSSNCSIGSLTTGLRVDEWANPGIFHAASFNVDDNGSSTAVTDCEKVPFDPSIEVQPTTDRAESPTGLNFKLRVPDQGIFNPDGLAQAYLKEAVVRLPEGMSINPSAGEGLGVCTPAQFARETASSNAGNGCPNSSKIGTAELETPLLEETLSGPLFIAQQDDPATTAAGAENPFDSLLAMYVVVRSAERGVVIKLSGKVTPDSRTGQLVTTFDDNPQLPFSEFTLRFREGQRSPLVSPPSCGLYRIEAVLTPWSASDPESPQAAEISVVSDEFQITRGVGGGPCPTSSATRAFNPALNAGTLNNNAGSYSPVNVRMTRNDGEQEITSFSADLPPGLVGKLAGIPYCSDAAIEAAKQKTGREELSSPSCPAASLVGNTLVGAGVGSVLAYAPGKVYLAGPYKGSPISIAAITSATVGPFDLGTVVVRSAFKVDPETAKVTVDSSSSDPIPHIIEGIPVHIRDIRVYVDKPEFTLNPTSCDHFSFAARLTGSGADFANPLDDPSVGVAVPFQAANCAALPFKPKLSFKLKGGTKRGQFPAFQATLKARPGDANLAKTTVVLPRSEFIEQGHIRTVCTRVQFKAQQCPAGSIYGYARAITPLFDTPVEGPVYLRSNGGERLLPDLVVSLKNGEIEVALAGFIDSVKGRVRNAFNVIPDAPVTKFTLNMLGGKKGLLVNHLDLCEVTSRADVKMVGQNGKVLETRPKMGTSCRKGRKGRGRGR